MKLLTEEIDYELLVEDNNGQKRLFIEGPFLQSEVKNRNGRMYPKNVMEREVARYIREFVDRNRAVGELGHPDTPIVNYERACIKIVSLKEDGNDWIGKAQILTTPFGNTVRALLNDGVVIGVSSRGVGTWKLQEGVKMINDDYHLATAADVVHDPSAPNAFVNSLMEHREWVWDAGGNLTEETITKIYNDVKKAKQHNLEEATLKAFSDFLSKL